MAACAGCGRVTPPDARFCMHCGTPQMTPCPHCSSELPANARFCAFCGQAVEAPAPPDAPVEMIKLVTVLFADVVGSTAQAELMHPEDTRALMAEFFDGMSEEIRAEGGTVERIIGDAIMADFGVPVAREDDPIRAVRAGRRMLDRLEKFNADRDDASRISIRVGINTGEVSTGGSFGEQLLVMGDAVNVAARLEQAAQPGTILIGERTARRVRDAFVLKEVESVSAKGKSEPLVAFAVEAEATDVADPAATFLIPLIGRDRELQKLQREFAGLASDGVPRLVTVIGDAGVGKSRLTREFLSTIAGSARLLFGRCLPYGDGITFWPLREIIRSEAALAGADGGLDERDHLDRFTAQLMAGASEHDRDTVRDALFATVGFQPAGRSAAADPRQTYRRLLDGWRLLLNRYAADGPVVVVIEDLHWADTTMLEVLDDLVRRVVGPVLFVCPTRPDLTDVHPTWIAGLKNYTAVNLDPLTHEDSCHFMSLLLELDDMPEQLTARIVDRAEGNPFFLEEILNHLIDEGHFALKDGRWEPVGDVSDLEVPDNVQAAIVARLDLLAPEERRLVQLASVIGRTFWKGLLQHLAGKLEVGRVLETLCRRHLITQRGSSRDGEPEYSFKHVLIRDVAYASVPRKLRGSAHASIARWIESTRGPQASEIAELVAHHFDRAYGCLEEVELRQKARVYFIVASRNAALRFATKQAERLGRRAVELSADGRDRVDALEMLADVFYLSGRGDEAWSTYIEALRELEASTQPDPATLSRICASAAIIPTRNWGSIDRPPPDGEVKRVLDLGFSAPAHDGGRRDTCLLLVARAFLDADRDRPTEAREAADRALELAEQLGDPDLVSVSLDALAGTYMHPGGRYGEVQRITQRRLSLVPELSDLEEIADVKGMAAVATVLAGHYEDAVRFATESAEVGRSIDVGSYMHGLNWRAQAFFMSGRWDEALRDEAEINRIERRSLDDLPGPYSARASAAACLCHILRGSTEAPRRVALMRRFNEESDWFNNVSALPARGLARLGNAEEALQWLDLSRWMYRAQHLEAACDIAGVLQDWDRVPALIADAREEVGGCGLVSLAFFADRLEGQHLCAQARWAEAIIPLQRASAGFAGVGAAWESAWSALLAAEALTAMRRVEDALPLCDRALQTFRHVGSIAETERGSTLLQELRPG